MSVPKVIYDAVEDSVITGKVVLHLGFNLRVSELQPLFQGADTNAKVRALREMLAYAGQSVLRKRYSLSIAEKEWLEETVAGVKAFYLQEADQLAQFMKDRAIEDAPQETSLVNTLLHYHLGRYDWRSLAQEVLQGNTLTLHSLSYGSMAKEMLDRVDFISVLSQLGL